MNSIDRCPLCGGDKEPGQTTFAVDLESCLIVVRKVPAKVCRQCGESWIGEETARQLEGLVQNARRNRTEVEILYWPQAA